MRGLAAHTARNLPPLLEVLRLELQGREALLEIGSGSGQHATCIAAELDHLQWQTSDRRCNHEAITKWLKSMPTPNVQPPLALDVLTDLPPLTRFDAAFSANTAHIMSEDAVRKMFEVVSASLVSAGKFCLYGPFRQNGCFNAKSNAEFDGRLRAQDPSMGIRELERLDEFARNHQLHRSGLYAMPANNQVAIWMKNTEALV